MGHSIAREPQPSTTKQKTQRKLRPLASELKSDLTLERDPKPSTRPNTWALSRKRNSTQPNTEAAPGRGANSAQPNIGALEREVQPITGALARETNSTQPNTGALAREAQPNTGAPRRKTNLTQPNTGALTREAQPSTGALARETNSILPNTGASARERNSNKPAQFWAPQKWNNHIDSALLGGPRKRNTKQPSPIMGPASGTTPFQCICRALNYVCHPF